MNKKITVIVVLFGVLCFLMLIIVKKKEKAYWHESEIKCSEVIFDFIRAINQRDIDRIDVLMYGRVPVDRYMVYYDKECVKRNLDDYRWNIIKANIGYVSQIRQMIRMSILIENEDMSESADNVILQKVDEEWKIIEFHGEGFFIRDLFVGKSSAADTRDFDSKDIKYGDFPISKSCDYNADYDRLH